MDNNTIERSRDPIAVDIKGLQEMTGVSKNTAMKIGREADAVIFLGIRRTLYNVEKVKKYLESKTGTQKQEG